MIEPSTCALMVSGLHTTHSPSPPKPGQFLFAISTFRYFHNITHCTGKAFRYRHAEAFIFLPVFPARYFPFYLSGAGIVHFANAAPEFSGLFSFMCQFIYKTFISKPFVEAYTERHHITDWRFKRNILYADIFDRIIIWSEKALSELSLVTPSSLWKLSMSDRQAALWAHLFPSVILLHKR